MKEDPSPHTLRQHALALTNWHDDRGEPLQLMVVLTDEGQAFFQVNVLCRALGVEPGPQLDRLREHAVLSQLIRQMGIETAGGPQSTWCIERRGIGFWWGGIQLTTVRKQVQERLLEFQWALVDAADRLLFGELPSDPVKAQLAPHDAQIASVTRFALQLEQHIGTLEMRARAETVTQDPRQRSRRERIVADTTQACGTCHGYGLWAIGDATPMGPMDAMDGMPTQPCPECGANANPSRPTTPEHNSGTSGEREEH